MTDLDGLTALLAASCLQNGKPLYVLTRSHIVMPFGFGARVEGDGTDHSTGESVSDEENEDAEAAIADLIVAAVNQLPALIEAARREARIRKLVVADDECPCQPCDELRALLHDNAGAAEPAEGTE